MKLKQFTCALLAAGCLALPLSTFAQSTGDCAVANEPNETRSNASSIPWNSVVNASISTASDVDWYRLDVTSDGLISATLANLGADYKLELYNPSGYLIASSDVSGTGYESVTIGVPSPLPTPSKPYYLKVDGKGNSSAQCYRLVAAFSSPNCSGDQESNDTPATAIDISGTITNPTGVINGKISSSTDVDWYTFTTTPGNTNIQIFLLDLFADFDIALYSASNTQNAVATSIKGSNLNEVITYNTNSSGKWYVRVIGFAGATSSWCYSLKAIAQYNTLPSNFRFAAASIDQKDTDNGSSVSAISLYPNPATSGQEMQVNIASADGAATVRILNASGSVVSVQKVDVSSGSAKVSLAGIEPGVYVLDAGTAGILKFLVK